ncbi:MAG TPA: radical SAM protein [Phycisphaerae bacterium]|nr:radical SAM protein [Phycisphaerae bacterium]
MNRQVLWHEQFAFPHVQGPLRRPLPAGEAAPAADDGIPPRKLYVELTTECNLDCAMCIRSSWRSPGGTMPAETFARLLEQLGALPELRTINLSGFGEPMAHPAFFEFVAQAKAAGLAVEVITNGTLLDEDASGRLIDLGLDRLVVSVDGIAPDASRGLHDGTFPQVAEALRRLHHMRLSRQVARPEVGIEFVATRRNIHELPQLRTLGLMLGFGSILVTNVIPHTPELAEQTLYERHSTACRPRRATPANPVVDLPLLDANSPAGEAVEHLRGVGASLRVNGAAVSGIGPRCRFVTEGRLAVRWDGQVSPCLALLHDHTYFFRRRPRSVRAYPLGNVNEVPLAAIWAAEEYRAFRDRVRRWEFSPCIDCGACDLRDSNARDCTEGPFPRCGECLWAAGIVQCP